MPGVIAEQQQEQQQAKARKPTKNEQRRAKKKQQKKEASATPAPTDQTPSLADGTAIPEDADANHPLKPAEPAPEDPIQDVPAVPNFDDIPADDPLYS
ncbi:hypothetical protein KC362_g10029, partial [Hortaea werneckii]